ncbi:Transcriptional repressor CcpN [Bacillus altitudinis]|jgi:CBS domain-containing protein|uniref:Negative regulator of gluconeogenesis n=2 Tax=Bacillus TaxID=1386 RepID=A0A1K2B8I9_BACAB|nr:transcriptional repressor [Bacillus stratosphericus LAMA 585]MCL4099861.1 Transcriptional repressor CcpN [Bacillus altitudinis]MDH8711037.1 CBS domain-containing protein [Micromonospora sp. 1209]CVM18192.1 DNA-binding protein [Streptococcus pneumoniae]CAI7726512.1 Transcriptional repressor CcpN [Bacillus altitudinis]
MRYNMMSYEIDIHKVRIRSLYLKVVSTIELNKRQEQILQIVKENGPITGEHIADRLNLTRATLRPDLAILTMSGFLEARPRVGYFFTGKTGTQLLADKLKKLQVKDFQSIPVVIHENVSVYDAICTMFLEDVGTLFVVDDHSILTGVLSRKDLLRASIGKQELPSIPVHIIMTRMPNITVCRKEDFIMDVAKHLIEKQIDALPVIKDTDKGFEVVGRITKTNMTKILVSLSENEII